MFLYTLFFLYYIKSNLLFFTYTGDKNSNKITRKDGTANTHDIQMAQSQISLHAGADRYIPSDDSTQ